MKLTQALYENAKEIWDSYLKHPFVSELGNGTLAVDKFRFYLLQDYLYLLDYAKVFALGVAKSKNEESMRRFAYMVHNILNEEMSIHKHYMERLGITKEEVASAEKSLANTSYTSYMLEVAYSQGELAILTAILSCAWSYDMIGKHHAGIPGAATHPLFGEWVQGYSSEGYAKSTQEMIQWIDELGENISNAEKEELINIFIRCSRYEYAFWEMAYQKEM